MPLLNQKDYKKQKGSALISALLLVSIVTLLATGMIWRQNIEIRRTESIFQNDKILAQSTWVELWAMEKLNEIFTQMNPEEEYISLDQKWTEPLQNVEREGLLIQASLTDLQSFFNINDIVIFSPTMAQEVAEGTGEQTENTEVQGAQETPLQESEEEKTPTIPSEFLTDDNLYSPAWAFERLLENTASLNQAEAQSLTEAILYWVLPKPVGVDTNDWDAAYSELPYQVAHLPLTSISELRLINGMTNEAYKQLEPYVTAIPTKVNEPVSSSTTVNINTTSDAVLSAILDIEPAQAQTLLSARPYVTKEAINLQVERLRISDKEVNNALSLLDISSQYFLLRMVISDTRRTWVQYSILNVEDGKPIKVIRRFQGEM